ncbi:hypothetical protein QBC43DRAFT_339578 [Cladorrhinum sp. PSN259]|nr:hypothetical protein QBC43DRAFT_339578 [Cladorrhinum sp. PSN259]
MVLVGVCKVCTGCALGLGCAQGVHWVCPGCLVPVQSHVPALVQDVEIRNRKQEEIFEVGATNTYTQSWVMEKASASRNPREKHCELTAEPGSGRIIDIADARDGKVDGPMPAFASSTRRVDIQLFLSFDPGGRVLDFEFRFLYYLTMYLSDRDQEPDHVVHILSLGSQRGDLMTISLNTAGIPLFSSSNTADTVDEIIWIFSVLVMAMGGRLPLNLQGERSRPPSGWDSVEDFVFWLTQPMQGAIEDKMTTLCPDSVTVVTGEYVKLDLLVFAAQPKPPSAESFETASRIVEDYGLEALARDFLAEADEDVSRQVDLAANAIRASGRAGPDGPLQIFLRVWIGLALDYGLDWVLRFPDDISADVVG